MRLTLTVPASALETAKRASQALDADVGGYYAFETQDEQGNYFYIVNLDEWYYGQIQALMADPTMLHGFISQQFALRFPTDPVPSLTECAALCANIVLS